MAAVRRGLGRVSRRCASMDSRILRDFSASLEICPPGPSGTAQFCACAGGFTLTGFVEGFRVEAGRDWW